MFEAMIVIGGSGLMSMLSYSLGRRKGFIIGAGYILSEWKKAEGLEEEEK